MDEDDWIGYWDRVKTDLYIPDWTEPRTTPGASHLDALEARLGFLLPHSYRGYVRVFGGGRIARRFTIWAPGYPHAPAVDFPDARMWRTWPFFGGGGAGGCKPRGTDPDRIAKAERMVPFGIYSGQKGVFAWHRDAVTDPHNRERLISFVSLFSDEPDIVLNQSFADLVMADFLGAGFFPKYGINVSEVELVWEDEETGERRTHREFDPIGGAVSPIS